MKCWVYAKQKKKNDRLDIKLITTNHKDYKYAGQALIASLGRKLIDSNGKTLGIRAALNNVKNFYSYTCGFKNTTTENSPLGSNFELNNEEINDFINRTESRTRGKILNLSI